MSAVDEARFADSAGRYRLDSRIATGGMGEVWRATDLVLDREVAVKVLKAEYADDHTFRHRFETEARHAGSLHHRGVAAVFDFGEGRSYDGGAPRPYLVMELVDGRPLSDLLRPYAPMDPAAACDLIAQAADAVAVAHRAGIVHRDLKPANMLVTPDRQVKITDFGIARAADGLALTQTGQVMGTPAYISPEQARGETATEASDIYALGVVLFECLAGHRPFVGETPVTTALAHVRQPVPDLPPQVPADIAAVCVRALAKDPAERYASAADFAAALRDPASAAARPRRAAPVPPPPVVPPADDSTQVLSRTPTGPVVPMPPPEDRSEPARARGVPAWVWVVLAVAVVLAAGALVVALTGGDGSPADDPTPTGTGSAATSAPTTDATSDGPASVTIDEDDYLGRDVDEVAADLRGLGLAVTRSEVDNPGGEEPDAVTDVNPTGTLQEGDRVTVKYWGPEPTEEPTPTQEPTTEAPTEEPTTDPTTEAPTPTEDPTTDPAGGDNGDGTGGGGAGGDAGADPGTEPGTDPGAGTDQGLDRPVQQDTEQEQDAT